jgi:hypothetical protein
LQRKVLWGVMVTRGSEQPRGCWALLSFFTLQGRDTGLHGPCTWVWSPRLPLAMSYPEGQESEGKGTMLTLNSWSPCSRSYSGTQDPPMPGPNTSRASTSLLGATVRSGHTTHLYSCGPKGGSRCGCREKGEWTAHWSIYRKECGWGSVERRSWGRGSTYMFSPGPVSVRCL